MAKNGVSSLDQLLIIISENKLSAKINFPKNKISEKFTEKKTKIYATFSKKKKEISAKFFQKRNFQKSFEKTQISEMDFEI